MLIAPLSRIVLTESILILVTSGKGETAGAFSSFITAISVLFVIKLSEAFSRLESEPPVMELPVVSQIVSFPFGIFQYHL